MSALADTLSPTSTAASTPMMQQYLAIKAAHVDCLLFYRMGDFYELFFDDALVAAPVLDIALTRRGKHGDDDIPMCGVPYHSYESYLHRLIREGFKVAICEQLESPEEAKKRGYKAVVRREVVRIITPGTVTEDLLLDAKDTNYLAALAQAQGQWALAWLDISTGEFAVSVTSPETFNADLARLNPKELLLPDSVLDDKELRQLLMEWKPVLSPHVASFFDLKRTEHRLKASYEVASLASFGEFLPAHIVVCGALLEYVSITQKGHLPHLEIPKLYEVRNVMAIDAATRRNLELFVTLSGDKKGSLLNIIDRTLTGCGGRLLRTWLAAPLAYAAGIQARLDAIHYGVEQSQLRQAVRDILKRFPDIERALSRITLERGEPRDLYVMRDGLECIGELLMLLEQISEAELPRNLRQYRHHLGNHDGLYVLLKQALKADGNSLARDGNFIAEGYHPPLDELRDLTANANQKVLELRDSYRQKTGISSLKITRNNVIGVFIEVPAAQSEKMDSSFFIHKQTMAGAVRYTTLELQELERNITQAKDRALRLELELFADLIRTVQQQAAALALAAQAVAGIDVVMGLAVLAIEGGYVRPQVEDSQAFRITRGRHPVVEHFLQKEGKAQFVANDSDLADIQRLWLVTGPNMAGKSTFLRQNALIAILAQMGSFVPAEAACIGTIDRLFSRIGAGDDLARGQSTFMVEMVETATILNQATPKSLVILDEIGRGTATFDGLSIAWACVEQLHNINRCRTLFATHYHELTSLAAKLKALRCYTVKVKEWQGRVVFLHEVIPGAADQSYGIHVAKLAGLPKPVTRRAEEILKLLQQSEGANALTRLADDLPLFASAPASDNPPPLDPPIMKALRTLDLDALSPKEAWEMLAQWKEMVT